jgi:type IV pilus assembly protein PilV
MTRRQHRPRPANLAGFSLVEILIALLVLSISLLGTGRITMLSVRSAQGSLQRTQAVYLAADIAERMRANLPGVTNAAGNPVGFYDVIAATYQTPADNSCTETSDAAAGTCTVAQMAAHDLWEWQQTLAQALPDGAGTVCTDGTPNDGVPGGSVADLACDNAGGAYAVKVWWTEVEPDGPVTKQYVLALQL